ncbi:glycosyltransferase family 9 protein [Candidatus Woesearchaeota archaeon]|nr:glycosyltransferase family 9 protein [Candidatus Woesearchaeota archaeon]
MIKIIKATDRIMGNVLCLILGLFSRKNNIPKNPKSILFIQLWGIGETILTLPAIDAVKKRYPSARTTILCTERNKYVYSGYNAVVTSMNPFRIKLFILNNFKKFDIVVDFEEYLNISAIISFFVGKASIGFDSQIRSRLYSKTVRYDDSQHTVLTFFDLVKKLGVKREAGELVRLKTTKQEKENVGKWLKKEGVKKGKLIALVPGAAESSKSRMWDKYPALGEILAKKYNATIVLVGAPYEKELLELMKKQMSVKTITTAGKITLRELFHLLEKCSLVISNDTGPMHIAAAQGTPVIGLFGPNTPTRWAPFSKKGVSIYKKMKCSPCINTHLGIVPECRLKGNDYRKCMKAVSVYEVVEKARKLLEH